jgi:hypothetical protein
MAKSDAADHVLNAVGLASAFAAVRSATAEIMAETQKPDVYKELMARHLDKALTILREKGMTPDFKQMLEAAHVECQGMPVAAAAPGAAPPPPQPKPNDQEEPQAAAAKTEPPALVPPAAAPAATAKSTDPWAWTYPADINALLASLPSA